MSVLRYWGEPRLCRNPEETSRELEIYETSRVGGRQSPAVDGGAEDVEQMREVGVGACIEDVVHVRPHLWSEVVGLGNLKEGDQRVALLGRVADQAEEGRCHGEMPRGQVEYSEVGG